MKQQLTPQQPTAKPKIDFHPLTDGLCYFTRRRIVQAVERFAEPKLHGELSHIDLESGTQLLIAGQPDMKVTFIGIDEGKCKYQCVSGRNIERSLLKVSTGWRYDVLVGEYWTKNLILSVFGDMCASERISDIQAVELVLLDKRRDELRTTWLSIGEIKEELVTYATADRPKRLSDMHKAKMESMRPPVGLNVSVNAPERMWILAPEEALRLTLEKIYAIGFTPISEAETVFGYSKTMGLKGKPIEFGKSGEIIKVKFTRDGQKVTEQIDLQRVRVTKGYDIGTGFRVVISGFPLNDDGKSREAEEADYILIASVLSPLNQLYSAYIIGARG